MNQDELETKMPPDPAVPEWDMILDISRRLTAMSDALHSPSGSLSLRLEQMENKAVARHSEMMSALKKIADEFLEMRETIRTAESDILDLEADVRLLQSDARGGAQVQ